MLFISYAREDRPAATKLIRELDAEGINVIIDPELSQANPFWREMVLHDFSKCDLMVALVSRSSDKSPWVDQEQRAFPGPTLSIAVGASRAGVASKKYVRPSHGIEAIRAALPPSRRRNAVRLHQQHTLTVRRAERTQRMRDQQCRLDRFVRSLGKPVPEIEGCVVHTRGMAVDVRRAGRGLLVGTLPVTNAQYHTFVTATGFPPPPTWERPEFRLGDAPVTGVDWFEASAFAAWSGGALPTEEQWCAAAKGTDADRRYATSDGCINPSLAHYARAFSGSAPASVKAYPPSPEGFYGLCGNTWDWCASPRDLHRAIRGGGYMDTPTFCTVSARYRQAPIDRDCCLGFRIVFRNFTKETCP